MISHSVAIILTAVNNLSDALSSLITILGTKLTNKPADKEHPYGYGQIEYLTSVSISVLILFAGFSSLQKSAEKIFHPQTPSYTNLSLSLSPLEQLRNSIGAVCQKRRKNSYFLITDGIRN